VSSTVLSRCRFKPVHPSKTVVKTIDITFAIAAYNAASFIEAAIASILSQTVTSIEVIVVDDASTDRTSDIVRSFMAQDDRVRLIRSERNAGPAASRNKALAVACGTWFAVVDADDLIAPDRSQYLLHLADSTGADIVADNLERFLDRTGQTVSTVLKSGSRPYWFLIDPAAYFQHNTMFSSGLQLGYLKPMFRVKFLQRHKLTYSERLWVGEDFDFCLRCLLADALYVATSESFYRYRAREGSLSWRLTVTALQELIGAHREIMSQNRRKGKRFDWTADEYVRALERANAFVRLVDLLKERRWRDAFSSVLARIDLVFLLSASARAHISKRVSRMFKRMRT
jgi:succinoglycan biosynthesis protein ExoO